MANLRLSQYLPLLYGEDMEYRKFLVLATAIVAVGFFAGAAYFEVNQQPAALVLKPMGFPTIGNPQASIEIVVFEDFQCHNCRSFSQHMTPKIRKEYIQTGKARYTMVPLAFMRGSKPIANAAVAVFRQAPDRFFDYSEALFHFPEGRKIDETALLEIAQKVGGIDLAKLKKAIDEKKYYAEVRDNLEWAKSVLGKDFRTPALYINGIPTSTSSFELIQMRMDHLLAIGKGAANG